MSDKSDICMCDICGLMRDCIWDGDLWICKYGCGDPIYECPECGNTNTDTNDTICQSCIDWLADPKNDPEPTYN
jgi:hypothetical protein